MITIISTLSRFSILFFYYSIKQDTFKALYLDTLRISPHGKIGLKQVIDTITHPMLNTSTQPLKVVQKTELKFKLMCKIRAPRLYWADIATSENINTRNEFTHF